MYRIGIIGTENSHAITFAKLLNLPDEQGRYRHEDARIVGVYGPDMESAQEIVEKTGVSFIADKPEDFIGKVDAMMITSRRGSVHAQYAMPFMEVGIPLFLDKPVTSDPAQAAALMEEARRRNVPVMGGSGCKLAGDLKPVVQEVNALREKGEFITAAMNFSVDFHSIYDGFYFYAPHLTEMALTAFGYDMRSVLACETNGTVSAIARYDDFDVSLCYTAGSAQSGCLVFGKKGNAYHEIGISDIFAAEVDHFVHMLHTGEMPLPYDKLIRHVQVIDAILTSLKTGKETPILA
ncbi:Gfo/Idh/MocA family protein [Bianquea renquensis]|jgi:hypothetical oxidoreductase|uniref:Gfo/Idh/MocA family oxidoreductase n=1 Tax=Bianquea renquensis TaxID=2763661 RepID=A0A926DS14_9FIRM|nr:Gfo/Idh/MocA family oxidoreductase [Bianquea renquensis]MBC8542235.1 Gfo/Idh/MocA family oxidoreductase [Bianquea renquensis]